MLRGLAKAGDADDDSIIIDAAMDAMGLEKTSASAHFVSRAGRKRRQRVKLSAIVAVGTLIPAALAVSCGPNNDKVEAGASGEGVDGDCAFLGRDCDRRRGIRGLAQRNHVARRPDHRFVKANFD